MRAVLYRGAGDAGVVDFTTIPDPEAGGDQLVVDVSYAGLNRADILERQGRYGPPDRDVAHIVPGLESPESSQRPALASATFAPVTAFGLTVRGAHAERLAVPAALAMRVPDALDLERAAAIPEAFITASTTLYRLGGLRLGKTVVIHAVGSGVGLAALALVKAAGGVTVGTSRSSDKLARACEYGLDYGALLGEDWAAVAMRVTNGRGADVVVSISSVHRSSIATSPRSDQAAVSCRSKRSPGRKARWPSGRSWQSARHSSGPCCAPGRSMRRSPSRAGSSTTSCRFSRAASSHRSSTACSQ